MFHCALFLIGIMYSPVGCLAKQVGDLQVARLKATTGPVVLGVLVARGARGEEILGMRKLEDASAALLTKRGDATGITTNRMQIAIIRICSLPTLGRV
jgi:hypothetical protein